MPYLSKTNRLDLQAEGIAYSVPRPEGGSSFDLDFTLCKCAEDSLNCPLLDTETGCRWPRAKRPWECLLWPLRLMKQGTGHVLAYYRNCPAMTKTAVQQLQELLSDGSIQLEKIKMFHVEHPESAREMRENYVLLRTL